MEENCQVYYLRLRGLPWSSTKDDITSFLQNVNICEEENAIIFTVNEDGKRTGDALVKVPTIEDLEKALSYHRNYMGKRYIEVLKSSKPEFSAHEQSTNVGDNERVVRLRGLPYSCVDSDIREFFQGLEIMPQGVVILRDNEGRCSGDAYVELYSPEDVLQALQRHRQKIGSRFIEVYRSSKSEMNYLGTIQATPLMSIHCKRKSVSPPPSRKSSRRPCRDMESDYCEGGYPPPREPPRMMNYREPIERFSADYRMFPDVQEVEKYIHVRGLPFDCREEDIDDFFYPIAPVSIGLCYGTDDRFNGECDVFFQNEEDCTIALRNHKKRIGKRYAELFMRTRRIIRNRHRRRSYSNESFEKRMNVKQSATGSTPREYTENLPVSSSQYASVSYPRLNQQPSVSSGQQQLGQNPYTNSTFESVGQNRIKVISYPETTPQAQYSDVPQTTYISTADYYKNLNANLILASNNDSSDPNSSHKADQKFTDPSITGSNQDRFYNYY